MPFTELQVQYLTAGVLPITSCRSGDSPSWLWPRRLARGKLTLLSGQPEVGKSFLAADIAARVAHHLSIDPADPTRRIFAPIKNNLARPPHALAFSLAENKITWHADPPPQPNQDPTARELAVAWLTDLLEAGPMPTRQVLDHSRAALFSYGTLRRAALDIGVVPRPGGFKKPWIWELPAPANTPCASLDPLRTSGEFAQKPPSDAQSCSTPS
jgi:hypothetical protein